MTLRLHSPVTGAVLEPEGGSLLRDGDGRLWPVIDGIPYLRTGRDDLVREAVASLERGDRDGALVTLLADQDDWWNGARPRGAALRRLVAERSQLSLRDAMGLLAFDRVGDYFAHRWSDPTFVAGLALLDAHWRPTEAAFELACGIGHYGRELMRAGVRYCGGDVVFSKLWLARHWVLPPGADLVCFDAAAPWPVRERRYDLVFCHDAFYFLEPKAAILATLRSLAAPEGRLALSHIHNRDADNLSAGRAMSASDVERMFPSATVYDDAELTRAVAEARPPVSAPLATLGQVEAFSLEDDGHGPVASRPDGPMSMPRADNLRLNPLYRDEGADLVVAWPSPRYEAEYGNSSTFPGRLPKADGLRLLAARDAAAIRARILLDLPERW